MKPHVAIHEPSSVHKKLSLILIILIVSATALSFAQSSLSELSSKRERELVGKHYLKTVRFSINQPENTYYYRFANLEYTEAFARLGYGFELYALPSERGLLESNSGRMDGDAGRIRFNSALAAAYPNLVRVTEEIASVLIGAYTADDAIHLNSWKDFTSRNLVIGYSRGLKIAEKRFLGHVDAKYLSDVADIRQGLRMIRRGRIDVMVAAQASVESVLSEAEFKDSSIVLAGIVEVVSAFPYLHKKHRELVPQLAIILKAMKKEGTYDRLAGKAKSTASFADRQ